MNNKKQIKKNKEHSTLNKITISCEVHGDKKPVLQTDLMCACLLCQHQMTGVMHDAVNMVNSQFGMSRRAITEKNEQKETMRYVG